MDCRNAKQLRMKETGIPTQRMMVRSQHGKEKIEFIMIFFVKQFEYFNLTFGDWKFDLEKNKSKETCVAIKICI